MPETMSVPSDTHRPLTGQHALVTGGARGIGAAIAEKLASFGANLSLLGRTESTLQSHCDLLKTRFQIAAYPVVANVADSNQVRAAFETATQALGPITLLINNAGVAESAPLTRTGEDLWQRMLDVNLTGTYLCCHYAVPAMVEAGFGRIVNIASTAGQIGYPYVTAYCAAKHGVVGFTRALALELAQKGITVNAVCPGFTDTDMTADTVQNIVKTTGRDEKTARAELARSNPQGRLIQPSEVAVAVSWLLTPEAKGVTGQSIVVAGGEVMP